MGAGKSTIGKELALQDGWQHIDTDQQIEENENLSIKLIFEQYGEAHFRALETSLLKDLLQQHKKETLGTKILLTTGGGMPVAEANRQLLSELGKSFYIFVPFDEIVNRLQADQNRPLWDQSQLDAMQRRYEERQSSYTQADYIIDASHKSLQEIVEEIKKVLG